MAQLQICNNNYNCISNLGRSHVVTQQPTASADPSGSTKAATEAAVKRSVFASVDQVPGFSAARELDKEQSSASSRHRLLKIGPQRSAGSSPIGAEQKQKLLTQAMQVAQRSRQRAVETASLSDDGQVSSEEVRSRRKHSDSNVTGIPVYRSPSRGLMSRRLSSEAKPHSLSPLRMGVSNTTASSEQETDEQMNSVNVSSNESLELVVATKTTSLGPKTLKPAEGLHVSLVADAPLPRHPGVLDSPVKLLPPAKEDELHRLALREETGCVSNRPVTSDTAATDNARDADQVLDSAKHLT